MVEDLKSLKSMDRIFKDLFDENSQPETVEHREISNEVFDNSK